MQPFLTGSLLTFLAGAGLQAVELRIERKADHVVLAWPSAATGYVLQWSPDLGAGGWMPVASDPERVGEMDTVEELLAETARYYRLRAAVPSAPLILGITAPTSLVLGESSVATLGYSDPDGDITTVGWSQANALGTTVSEIPAEVLSLLNPQGEIDLALKTGRLVLGPNEFTVTLKDDRGLVSASQRFVVEVVGRAVGGVAPVLSGLELTPGSLRRPRGPRDSLGVVGRFSYTDPDGDLERLRLRVTDPQGAGKGAEFSAAALGMNGGTGVFEGPLFSLHAGDPLGAYAVELVLIDAAGHLSGTASGIFTLQTSGGEEPLAITGSSPTSGLPGAMVVLHGSGFAGLDPAVDQVTLGGVPLEVAEATAGELSVLLPANASSGRFRVERRTAVACSPDEFLVPERIQLTPSRAQIPVRNTLQLTASVVASGEYHLVWSVDGLPGGNPDVGFVSPDGLYRSPGVVPAGEVVVVTAWLASKPEVGGEAEVRIVPQPPVPGRALILPQAGGQVQANDGRSKVTVPAGALTGGQEIFVTTLYGEDVPASPPDEHVVGAARFEPEGTAFAEPVTITLPLNRHMQPGTQLSLQRFDEGTRRFVDEGRLATVAESGAEAVAEVLHFSVFAVLTEVVGGTVLPVVSAMVPAAGVEGMKLPVHFRGQDLLPWLELQVLRDGAPTGDIHPGTLFSLGEEAGAVLDIQTLPDLGEGESRVYTLRLHHPGTALFTDVPFTVEGLDEWIVEAGPTLRLNNPPPRRYSSVRIEPNAVVQVDAGHLDVEATGPITIDGSILAEGGAGMPGNGVAGGVGATGASPGGDGGQGRSDDGCGPGQLATAGTAALNCAPPESYGGDGNVVVLDDGVYQGRGGKPGKNLGPGFFDLVVDVIGCLDGNLLACFSAVVGVIELVDDLEGLDEGEPLGKPGENGVYAETPGVADPGHGKGGGGGGGGGVLEIDFVSDPNGGGGGGGGGGGLPLSLATADCLRVNGRLSTMGGDGGDGAPSPDSKSVPLFGKVRGFSGGGGGGGSGGRMTLVAGEGFALGEDGSAAMHGGLAGCRTVLTDGEGRTIRLRRKYHDQAPHGLRRITEPDDLHPRGSPVFARPTDLLSVETKVTFTGVIRAEIHNGITLRVVHEGQTNDILGTPLPSPNWFDERPYRVITVLQPGLNTLQVPGMHRLLHKQILYLPGEDTDGDGLSDPDEAILGTNPNLADTDADGLGDLDEVIARYDPLDPDMDDDGFLDGEDVVAGTSPTIADTDEDGFWDSAEVLLGSDPLLATSVPERIRPDLLYASSSGGADGYRLTLIEPGTGRMGLLGQPNGLLGFGLALDFLPRLYVARHSDLALHDPLSGETASVGDLLSSGLPITTEHLTYHPVLDRLFAVESAPPPGFEATGQLLRVDPNDGTAERLSLAGPSPIHSLLCTKEGNLYAAVADTLDSDKLVELDPGDGAVLTEIGPMGYSPVYGMAVAPNGVVYASQVVGFRSRLLRVDLTTGVATPLGRVLHRAVFDLAAPAFQLPSPLVSINARNAAAGDAGSGSAVWIMRRDCLTPDGRFVVFGSDASDLTGVADENATTDVFVRDLEQGTTALISVDVTGTGSARFNEAYGSGVSLPGPISDDGRYVLFTSMATNLTAFTALAEPTLFRRDLVAGVTELVAMNASGTGPALGAIREGAISGNGRFVTFHGGMWHVPGYLNLFADVWLRDMTLHQTRLVSADSAGAGGNGVSLNPLVSADGRYIVFQSEATNLSPLPDANEGADLFYFDALTSDLALVTRNVNGTAAANAPALSYVISRNGRYVAFTSQATDLTDFPDTNEVADVFLWDRASGIITLVTVNAAGNAAVSWPAGRVPGGAGLGVVTDDGVVAFSSDTPELVVGDTNDDFDVFVFDIRTGMMELISMGASGLAPGNGASAVADLSRDGSRVAFISGARDLVEGVEYESASWFALVRDRTAATTTLISTELVGPSKTARNCNSVFLSGDGHAVIFECDRWEIVRIPDTNGALDLYHRRLP